MAKIFLVEDEEEIQEMIKIALESNGHSLTACSDGMKALEILKTESFDLAIMDVMIPGLDGYSILDELEKDPNGKEIPSIVITALKPAERLFSKFKRVKYFLAKPFSSEELVKKVDEILQTAP